MMMIDDKEFIGTSCPSRMGHPQVHPSLVISDQRTHEEIENRRKTIIIRNAICQADPYPCSICGELIKPMNMHTVKDSDGMIVYEFVCSDCEEPFKCEGCGEFFPQEQINDLVSIDGVQGERLCERCEDNYISDDRMEPIATVIYSDGKRATIGQYHDDTDGDFIITYNRTDVWRGHYDVESTKYYITHSDCILSFSDDEKDLKNFDDALRQALDELGIKYARVLTRTSNICSQGYDFFVEKSKAGLVTSVVEKFKEIYRDPVRFHQTAMTGKNPDDADFDEKDELFSALSAIILSGTSEIKEEDNE